MGVVELGWTAGLVEEDVEGRDGDGRGMKGRRDDADV